MGKKAIPQPIVSHRLYEISGRISTKFVSRVPGEKVELGASGHKSGISGRVDRPLPARSGPSVRRGLNTVDFQRFKNRHLCVGGREKSRFSGRYDQTSWNGRSAPSLSIGELSELIQLCAAPHK